MQAHKYISRKMGTNGKWEYVYAESKGGKGEQEKDTKGKGKAKVKDVDGHQSKLDAIQDQFGADPSVTRSKTKRYHNEHVESITQGKGSEESKKVAVQEYLFKYDPQSIRGSDHTVLALKHLYSLGGSDTQIQKVLNNTIKSVHTFANAGIDKGLSREKLESFVETQVEKSAISSDLAPLLKDSLPNHKMSEEDAKDFAGEVAQYIIDRLLPSIESEYNDKLRDELSAVVKEKGVTGKSK